MLIDNRERENLYFNAIKEEFQHCQLGVDAQARVVKWLDDAVAHRLENDLVEQVAGEILQAYPQLTGGDGTRYQFKASSQKNELIKCIFDKTFKRVTHEGTTERIIQLAESASSDNRAFYPKWKKIICINLPKYTGNVIDHPLFHIVASIVVIYATVVVVNASYVKIADLTARVWVPFIINNTPLCAIRIFNKSTDILFRMRKIALQVLWGCILVKWLVSKLEIPCVNQFLDRIDFWKILLAIPRSTTLFRHALDSAGEAFLFTNFVCRMLSARLENMAISNEHRQIAVSREKAFEVWNTVMRNRLELVAA